MKNLKQVLALGMAFSLTMSTMAGAAFTDKDSINKANTDAVELLTTLDVIQGFEDGSFRPEETVTRAQMAKMIYTIRNGGNDNADAYKSATTTFTDISGHWAEGYIKYLWNTGIIAGKSETTFDPDATVTTAEAMKMALVLGGYRADKANLTGATWFNNTVSLATTNQLTDDVYSAMNGDCTRQDAAQILANVLDMTAVQWSEFTQSFLNDSESGLALGGNKMTVGYKWMDLMTDTGKINVAPSSKSNPKGVGFDGETYDKYFKNVSKDVSDLLGYEVKVVWNEEKWKNGDADAIYGIYKTSDNTSYETVWNAIDKDGSKVRFDGNSYDLDSEIEVYADKDQMTWENAVDKFDNKNTRELSDKVVFIDNDGDGKIDAAQIKTQDVTQVTYVGSNTLATKELVNEDARNTDETHQGVFYKTSSGVYDYDADVELKDVNVYEGIAKDDFAKVSYDYFNDKVTYEKIEVLEGKVDSTRTTNNGTKEIRIDGNWYKPAEGYDDMPSIVSGDTVAYVAIGELLYNVEKTDGLYGSKYIATVVDLAKYDVGFDTNKIQIKLQTRDGSTKTAILDKYDNASITVTAANSDVNSDGVTDFDDYGVSCTKLQSTNIGDLRTELQGKLIAYRESGSNVSLVPVTASQKAGYMYQFNINTLADGNANTVDTGIINGTTYYEHGENGYNRDNGTVYVINSDKDNISGPVEIADDAVVFFWDGNDSDAMTGKAAKSAIKAAYNAGVGFSVEGVSDVATGEKINGVNYVQAITIQVSDVDDLKAVGNNYAYVLAAGEVINDGDYRELHLWTANGAITVYESTSDFYTFDGGEIISYDIKSTSDDRTVVNNVSEVKLDNTLTNAQLGTVTSNGLYDNNTSVAIDGKAYDLAKNCQIVNVNTLDMEGISSGEEAKGAVRYGQPGKSNILYVANADNEIVFILVDTQNEEIITKDIENPTAGQIQSMLKYAKSGETVTVKGDVPAGTYTVPTGVNFVLDKGTGSGDNYVETYGSVVINGNVQVAAPVDTNAGTLTVKGNVNSSVDVHAGNVVVDGRVTGNATVNAGATLTVNGNAVYGATAVRSAVQAIAGTLTVNGGAVTVNGAVKAVKIMASNVKVDITGDVVTLTIDTAVKYNGGATIIKVTGNVGTLTNNSSDMKPSVTGDVSNGTGGVYENGNDTTLTPVQPDTGVNTGKN